MNLINMKLKNLKYGPFLSVCSTMNELMTENKAPAKPNSFSFFPHKRGTRLKGFFSLLLLTVAFLATGQTLYYSKSTGNLEVLSNWGQNTDGTGTAPANFTADNQVFNIRNNATPTIGANWTVSGASSLVIVGDGTNNCTFTVPGALVFTAPTQVSNNGTLRVTSTANPPYSGTLTVNSGGTYEHARNGGTIPAATWNSGSNCNVTGVTGAVPGGLVQSFGNFNYSSTLALTLTGTLTVKDNLSITNGGILAGTQTIACSGNVTGTSNLTFTTGTLDIGGNYTNTGTFTCGTGTVNFSGVNQNVNAFTYNNLSISGSGTKTLQGNPVINGNLSITGGTFNLGTTATAVTVGGTTTINSATGGLNFGTGTSKTFTSTGILVFTSGTLEMSGASGNILDVQANLNTGGGSFGGCTNNPEVRYTGANQNVIGLNYCDLSLSGTGTKTMVGNVGVSHDLDISGSTTLYTNTYSITGNATGSFSMASGTGLTLGSTAGATAVLFPTNYVAANIALNAASTVTYQSNTNQAVSAVPVYGNLIIATNATTKTCDGDLNVAGTLSINGTSVLSAGTTAATWDIGGATSVAGTLNFGTVTAKTINIGGNLSGTGTINMSGAGLAHTLSLRGATNTITTLTTTNGAGSTVDYSLAGAQQVFVSANYQNLFIGGSGNKTFNAGSPITVNGNLTVNGSSLNFDAGAARTLNVAGNVSGTGTIDMSPGNQTHTMNLSGASNDIGTFTTSSAAASLVTYNRAGDQTVIGSPNYRRLTFAGGGTKSILNNVIVGSQLNLTLGIVRLGNFDLTIDNGATSSAGGVNNMVVTDGSGEFMKVFPAGASNFIYPVGDISGTNDYSPVSITYSANSDIRTIGLRATDTQHPDDGSVNDFLSRYWSFTDNQAGTYTYDINLTYSQTVPSDLTGVHANLRVNRWNGLWTQYNTAGAAPNIRALALNETIAPLGGSSFTGRSNIAIYTWNQAGGGDYQVPANWTPARLSPQPNDILQFVGPASPTVTNVPTQQIGGLVFSNGINVIFQSAAASTLTINNLAGIDFIINPLSSLVLDNNVSITLAAGTAAGVDGILSIGAGNTYTTNAAASITTVSGTVNNQGTVTGSLAGLVFTAGSTYNHNRDGGAIPTSSWNSTSTCNIAGITTTAPLGMGQNFGNIGYSSAYALALTGPLTMTGNLAITGGSIAASTFAVNLTGNLTGTNDFSLTTGTLTIRGDYSNSGTFSGGTVNYNGAAQQVKSTTYNNIIISGSGDKTMLGNVTVSGLATFTAGSLVLNGAALNLNGTVTVTGGSITGSLASSIAIGGNNTAAMTLPDITGGLLDFTINKTGTNGTVTLGGDLDVSGAANFTEGALILNGRTLNLNGTTSVGLGTITGSLTSSLGVSSNNNAGMQLPLIATGLLDFTVNKTGTINTVALGSNLIVAGSINLSNGSLLLNDFRLTINGSLSQTFGTITGGGLSDLTVGTPAAPSTTIPGIINGIRNFTLNRSAGIILSGSNTVTGTLALTSGKITLGSNDLTLTGPAAVTGSSSSNFVIADGSGQLKKVFASGSTAAYILPVGDSSGDYSPVSLTFTANSDQRTIGVTVTDAIHPADGGTSDNISRYWTFTDDQAGTYTYNASFTYISPADLLGAHVNLRVNRWDGKWTQYTTTGVSPVITMTGGNEISAPIGSSDFTGRKNAQITYTWKPVGLPGDWTTAANWIPDRLSPQPEDILVFDGNGITTATNVPSQSIARLVLSGNSDVSLQSALPAQTLTISGASGTDLDIPLGTTLQLSSVGANQIGIAFGPLLQNISVAGTLVINPNAAQSNNFSSSNSNTVVTGTIRNNGGTFTSAAANLNFNAGSFYIHNRDGGSIPAATWNTASNLNISGLTSAGPAGLGQIFGNVNYSSVYALGLTGNLAVTGNLDISAGSIAGTVRTINLTGNLTGAGDLSFTTGTLNIGGNYLNSGTFSGGTVNYNGADQLVRSTTYNNLTISGSGNKTMPGDVTVGGTATFTAGALVINGNTLNLNNGVVVTGGSITGSLVSNLAIGGNNTAAMVLPDINGGLLDFTINKTGTNSNVTLGGNLDVAGTASFTSGALLLNGRTLNLNGSTSVGLGTITGSLTSSIVVASSGNSDLLLPPISVGLLNLTVNKTGTTNTVTMGSILTVAGALTLTDGSLLLNNYRLIINGSISQSLGTITGGGTSDITVGSPAAPSLTIPAIANGVRNFLLNRSAGIILGGDITVSGTLTLTSGNITLGSNDLTLSGIAAVAGANATNHIIADDAGQLKKVFDTGVTAAYVLPIGDSSGDYSPVTLSFAANSIQRTVGVRVTDAVHPNDLGSSDNISRYWSFTDDQAGTYTYTASFTYINPADLFGAHVNLRVNRWDGKWTQYTTTGASPVITATGITEVMAPLNNSDFTGRLNPPSTYNWDKPGTTADWTDPLSWTPVRLSPQPEDILIFNNSGTTTATNVPTQSIAKLVLATNSDVSLESSQPGRTLAISGASGTDLDIPIGSTLQLSSSGANQVNIAFGPLLQNISVAGSLIINANDALSNTFNSSNSTTVVTGSVTNNGGIITSSAANLAFNAGAVYNHSRDGGTIPTASWNSASNLNITGLTAVVPAGMGQVFGNVNYSSGFAMGLAGNLSVTGNLDISAGSIAGNTRTINLTGNLTGTNGLSLTSGTLNIGGDYSNSGTFSGGTVNYNFNGAGQLVKAATYNNLTISGSGNKNMQGDVTISGAATFTAGTLVIDNHTLNLNGTVAVTGGTITGGASSNLSVGGNNTAAMTLPDISGGLQNLTINKTGTNRNVTLGGNLDVTGAADFTSGALVLGGNTLNLNGTTSVGAGTITGSLTSSLGIASSSNAGMTLPNITVGLLDLTVNKTGTISTVTLGGNLIVAGAIDLTNGALELNNYLLTINGSLNRTSGSITGGGNSDITVGTPAAAAISLPAVTNGLRNLTINRSAGITLDGANSVSGTLTLTSGKITLGTYDLTLSGAAAVGGANSTNYIIADGTGQLKKVFASGATAAYVLPVGDISGDYSPVSLTFTANSVQRTIGVRVTDDFHPADGGSTDKISRYWSFTNDQAGTYTCNVSFTYISPADLTGLHGNLRVSRWDGTVWTAYATAGVSPVITTLAQTETTMPLNNFDFTGRSVTICVPPTPLISGSNAVCPNESAVTYSTPSVSGHSYNWVVTGGVIVGSASGNSIIVDWGGAGTGTVRVTETFFPGCFTTTPDYSVAKADLVAPVITCPGNLTAICDISERPAYANLAAFTAAGGIVSDNCGINAASFALLSEISDGLACPETFTRTYQITDINGNTSTCTQTITVNDVVAPVITGSLTATTVEGCAVTDAPAAAGTVAALQLLAGSIGISDNCTSNANLLVSHVDVPSGVCPFIVTRTYSVTDECGNSASIIHTITIDDTQPPVVSGTLTTITVEGCVAGDAPAAATTVAGLQALAGGIVITDACTPAGSIVVTSSDASSGTCPVVVTRTYTVTDGCGNSTTITHVINVDDTLPPVVVGTITTSNIEGCNAAAAPAPVNTVAALEALVGGISITDDCTADGALTVTHADAAAGTCPLVITRTYTVTDACLNSVTITHTININDTQAPVVTGSLLDATVEGCSAAAAPAAVTTVSALELLPGLIQVADVCTPDAALTVSHIDVPTGTCPIVITRTYRITDGCGNIVNIIHTINVDDTQPPAITGSLTPLTVEGCSVAAAPVAASTVAGLEALAGGITVSDLCTAKGSLIVSHIDVPLGTCPIVISRTYTVTDACGNGSSIVHTINIDDTQAPVVTGTLTTITVEGCGVSAAPPAAFNVAGLQALLGSIDVSDICTPDAALVVTHVDVASGTCPIVITRTYTVTDACLNSLTIVHTINIDDTLPPVVVGVLTPTNVQGCTAGDAPVAVNTVAGLESLVGAITITDACTNDALLTVTHSEASSGTCPLVVTRTYTVSDACGNNVNIVHTINIDDTQAPVVTGTLTASTVEGCNAAAAPAAVTTVGALEALPGGITITDACTADAALTVTSSSVVNGTCPIVITRTYTITDACGNSINLIHTINVDDTQAPVVTGSLTPLTIEGCDAAAAPAAVTTVGALEALAGAIAITDACTADAALTVTSSSVVNSTCPIVITRTYTVTDACGNSVNILHTINVDDTQAPVVTGVLTPLTIEGCNAAVAPAAVTTVAALEGLAGSIGIADACTADAALTVTNLDVISGTCPIVITRTYRVTDACGNSVNIIHTINVDDTQAPAVAGSLAPLTVEGCNAAAAPAAVTTVAALEALAGGITITDVCTNDALLTVTHSDAVSGTCPLVVTRTYTVSDACGNSVNIIHTINVDDTQAPVVAGTLTATTVEGCNAAAAPVAVTTVAALEALAGGISVTDGCTPDAALAVSSSSVANGTCPIVITRTYTVTDACGNSVNIIHTINVDDTQAPVVTGTLTATTVEGCNAAAAPVAVTTVAALEALAGGITITDVCTADAALTVSSSSVVNGTCPIVITRTYTVTDACGNSVNILHTINVDDTQAPVVAGSLTPLTVEGCNAAAIPPAATTVAGIEALAGGLTIADVCTSDAALTVVSSTTSSGTCPIVVTRTYTVTDGCGNSVNIIHTINVDDTQAPVVAGSLSPLTVEGCNAAAAPAAVATVAALEALAGGVTITDGCTPDNLMTVTSSTTSSGTCPLIITRTYTVSDACGNSVNLIHTINVDDTQAPVVTGTLTATTVEGCNAAAAPVAVTTVAALEALAGGITITDGCTPDAALIVSSSSVANGTCPILITRTYTVTDACGNSVNIIHNISVDDTQAPVVTGSLTPLTIEGCVAAAAPAAVTTVAALEALAGGITITDGCTADGALTVSSNSVANGSCPIVITRTYTVTDACGNSVNIIHTINVDDTQTPVIAGSLTPLTVEGCNAAAAPPAATTVAAIEALAGGLTITDGCTPDALITVTSNSVSSGTCPIVITRTYTVSDACGNSANIVHTINVDDTQAPVVTGTLTSLTVEGCNAAAVPAAVTTVAALEALPGSVTIADICTPDAALTVTSNSVSAGTCPIVVTRTYTVTDACGNSVNIVQIINVDDTTPPVVTNSLTPLTLEGCNASVAPPAAATVAALEALAGGVTINDACTPDASMSVSYFDVSAGTCPIVVTRTYTIRDACLNSVTLVHIINIDDNTAPVVTGSLLPVFALGCSAASAPAPVNSVAALEALPGAVQISDVCSSDAALTVTSTSTSAGTCPIIVTRTYTITDACGNSANIVQTINISDNQAPVVSGTLNTLAASGCSAADAPPPVVTVAALEALPGGVTISDNCNPDASLSVVSNSVSSGTCPVVVTRTYTISDLCGNSVNLVHIINVTDVTSPVVVGSPATTNIAGCSAADAPPPATTVAGVESLTGGISVTDGCVPDASLIVTSTSATAGTCPIVVTRTYTIRDICGNSSTLVHTINVFDNQPPVVTGSVTATNVAGCNAGAAPPAVTTVAALEALTGGISIADVCTPDALITVTSTSVTSGTCPIIMTRTYTLTDGCGNSVNVIHTINIDDTQAPLISGSLTPLNIEGCNAAVAPAPVNTVAALEALPGGIAISDLCTSDASLVVTSSSTSAGTCPIVITRVYTVTDACGNSANITQTISIDDSTPPVITGSIPVSTIAGCSAADALPANTVAALEALGLVITDACTTDPGLIVTSTFTSAGTCPVVVTRTYTVTDACGNSSTAIQTVNVDDNTAPVITGTLSALTVEGCNATSVPAALTTVAALEALPGSITITDACTPDASLTITSTDLSSGTCPIVITRTYTIRDLCGNSVNLIHTINVDDSTAPAVTGTLTSTTVEGCSIAAAPPAVTTVAALESLAGSISIADACTPDAALTVTSSNVTNGTCPIVLSRTYTVTDVCGNSVNIIQTINIDDTQAPAVSGVLTPVSVEGCNAAAAPAPVTTVAALEALPGSISISDLCTSDALLTVTSTSTPAGTCPIIITRRYTVSDACGNSVNIVQIINVDDNTAPVVGGSLTPLNVSGCDASAAPAAVTTVAALEALAGGITITDACTADAALTVTSSQVSAGTCPLVITRTYTVTDACGNSSTIVHVINVNDTTAPVVTGSLTPTLVEGCGVGAAPVAVSSVAALEALPGGITITDACTPDVGLLVSSSSVTSGTCPRVITRTYTVTDACGNSVSLIHILNVDDTQPPVVTGSPTSLTLDGCNVSAAPAAATSVAGLETLPGITSIADVCTTDANITVTSTDVPSGTCPIVLVRTYTLSDVCGNTVNIVHTINIDDNTSPVITGALAPLNIEGCTAFDAIPLNTVAALEARGLAISDNCTADAAMTVTSSDVASGTCPIVVTRTYTVTDACGNSATVTQVINVDDNAAPVVAGSLSQIDIDGCNAASAPAAVTTVAALEALAGGITVTDACTPDASLVVTSTDVASGSCPIVITRTYTVRDICNNSVNIVQIINVDDNTAPVIDGLLAPTLVEGCAAGDAPPAVTTVAALEALTGGITVTDACTTDAGLTVTSSDVSAGTCPIVLTRTYTVTDVCGNSSTVVQIFNIGDNTPPVVTGTIPASTLAGCSPADAIPVSTVAELEALGVAIADVCTPDASLVVTSSDAVAGTCPAVVTRTYTIADACDNRATVTQVITVSDLIAPVVTGTITPSFIEGCDALSAPAAAVSVVEIEALAGGVLISDNCTPDGSLTVSHTDISTGTCPTILTRTYTILDACSNSATLVHTITIDDTTPPAVAGAIAPITAEGCTVADAPAAVTTVADLEALDGGISVNDVCTPKAALAVTYRDDSSGSCPLVITRIYTISDACLNSVDITQIITLEDNTAPTIAGCPADIAVGNDAGICGASVLWTAPVITDNCSSPVVVSSHNPGDIFPVGTTPVTITATDNCGNTVSCSFNVTVTDTELPSVTCPADIFQIEDVGFAHASVSIPVVVTADNCSVSLLTWSMTGATTDASPLAGINQIGTYIFNTGVTNVTYVVADPAGNTATCAFTVTVAPPLSLSGSITAQTNVACFGNTTGSVTVTGNDGYPPYEYSLNGGTYQSSGAFGSLAAGSYTVTVRDASLGTFDVAVTITQPVAALGGTVTSQTDVLCFSNNTGSVTVAASDGTSPYLYSLNGAAFQPSGIFTTLTAGSYSVTIQDANSCTFVVPVTITQPLSALSADISSQTSVSCSGGSNGSATAAGAGGTAPYEYSINGGAYQASGTFNTLAAGTFTITVRDANLCTADASVTITEPAPLELSSTVTDATCPGEPNGAISLTITGGTQPYTVIWADGATGADRASIKDGIYSVVVTDSNGCAASLVITVGVSGTSECVIVPTIITPNSDGYNDEWQIRNISIFPDAEVQVFNRWGERVFSTKNPAANPWDGTYKGKVLPMDSYHYVLYLNDGSDPRSGTITIMR